MAHFTISFNRYFSEALVRHHQDEEAPLEGLHKFCNNCDFGDVTRGEKREDMDFRFYDNFKGLLLERKSPTKSFAEPQLLHFDGLFCLDAEFVTSFSQMLALTGARFPTLLLILYV